MTWKEKDETNEAYLIEFHVSRTDIRGDNTGVCETVFGFHSFTIWGSDEPLSLIEIRDRIDKYLERKYKSHREKSKKKVK